MKKIANSPERYSIVIKNNIVYVVIQYRAIGYNADTPFIVYRYDADAEKLVQICTFYMKENLRQFRPLLYKAMTLLCWAICSGNVKLSLNSVQRLTANDIERLVKLYERAYTSGLVDNKTSYFPL
jgi:hypothetical protein